MTDDWRQDETRRAKAARIDPMVPNPARVDDYLRGGRSNFEADRRAAQALLATAPVLTTVGPAIEAFKQRVVRFLAGEVRVKQFLDIGIGLALSGNTHEVAQAFDPSCRVVYVDNDPMVLAHARALMKSAPPGATSFVDADVHNPGEIVAAARATLNFGLPVAVLLLSTLAHVQDTSAAAAVVASLADAVPSGSYVALYHLASDLDPTILAAARWSSQWPSLHTTLRSRDEIALLVRGLELVDPGLVPICEWRPAPDDPRFDVVAPVHAVVARKP